MFMDIDHFKQVNDTFGHSFGDKVLVKAAAAFREVMREYELLCRYGGEEFAAFIENTAPKDGQIVAERIRNKVAEISFADQPEFKFTISIGIATGVPRHNDTITEFINKADESLYEAKENGRNRVVEKNFPI
jgi:diguanylate cyclase (GGDEF) domain